MKIFWSWQSDTHQPTGRHFVRDVLAQLASELTDLDETIDADRPMSVDGEDDAEDAARDEGDTLHDDGRIEVDHDTHGVGGSPPIAETILRKIRETAVFVADVTPICRTTAGKRVPNPNVMIELGYAMREISHERIVLVMNQAEGAELKHLPFDLRHWRAPATYKLSKGATDQQMAEAAAILLPQLRSRIVPSLKVAKAAQYEDRRRTQRAPELRVTRVDEDKAWTVSQEVRNLGVPSLEEIKRETPELPLPPQRDPRLGSLGRGRFSQATVLSGLGRTPPPSEWTREETQGYNSWVASYHSKYALYLQEQAEWLKRVMRSATVSLKLENTGTLPATGIDVEIAFPSTVSLHDEGDEGAKFPAKPTPPQKPPLRPMLPGVGIVRHANPLSQFSFRDPSMYLPRSTSIDPAAGVVRFTLSELKHNHNASIEDFIVTFPNEADISSFKADYVITANEPIDPIRGTLRFAVERNGD